MKDTNWVGASAAAALVGVSRQALLKRAPLLEQLGVAVRDGRAWRYDPARLAAAYSGDVSDDPSDDDTTPALLTSRAKREHCLARLAQLELDERRGELLRADDVEREAFAIARRVREAMTNIPDRIAAEVAALSDAAAVHQLLSREIRAALVELADGPDLPD